MNFRIACIALLFSALPVAAIPGIHRPILIFAEGSLGSTWTSARDRETEAIDRNGPFYWQYNGNYYRYNPSELTLTAGVGFEFLAFDWMGLRATYSYSSYLLHYYARAGSSRYSSNSSLGGQIAETNGYFIGPIFRIWPFFSDVLALEFPLQWGVHTGSYYPLRAYRELRTAGATLPSLPQEGTEQELRLHKWRYGLGLAFMSRHIGFYASLSFCFESGITKTDVGPDPLMPAGSGWTSFLVLLAAGWRL